MIKIWAYFVLVQFIAGKGSQRNVFDKAQIRYNSDLTVYSMGGQKKNNLIDKIFMETWTENKLFSWVCFYIEAHSQGINVWPEQKSVYSSNLLDYSFSRIKNVHILVCLVSFGFIVYQSLLVI